METKILNEDSKTLLVLSGRLDTTNVGDFEKQISSVYQLENPDIIIDCEEFTYISSSGLRIFLTMQKYVMSKSGSLVIKNLKPEIKEVFDMTGFSSIFTIE